MRACHGPSHCLVLFVSPEECSTPNLCLQLLRAPSGLDLRLPCSLPEMCPYFLPPGVQVSGLVWFFLWYEWMVFWFGFF